MKADKFVASFIEPRQVLQFVHRVFDVTIHKGFRILGKSPQAGQCAEIHPLTLIFGAGIFFRFAQNAAADSLHDDRLRV